MLGDPWIDLISNAMLKGREREGGNYLIRVEGCNILI